MNEVIQFAMLTASAVYFWTVMFERFSRSCAAIGALIFVGSAGVTLNPAGNQAVYETTLMLGITLFLLGRSWLIWKELYHGE